MPTARNVIVPKIKNRISNAISEASFKVILVRSTYRFQKHNWWMRILMASPLPPCWKRFLTTRTKEYLS